MLGVGHDRRDSGSMSGERGSALVIAVLVMAIMTLLGVSFLLIDRKSVV